VIGGVAIGGGIGTISGVVLGTVFIQVLATGLDIAGVGAYQQAMITGVVIVAAGLIALMRARDVRQILRRAAENISRARPAGRRSVRVRS
jgi:ribose/xylose/arabinose/galactoside ABC-type transport system permease subunit